MTDLHQKIEEILTKKLSARKIAHTPLGDTDILNADTIASWISPVLHSLCLEYIREELEELLKRKRTLKPGPSIDSVGFWIGVDAMCDGIEALLDAIEKEEER